jgi:hypothetical protein|nr:MAG TPA: hypothetical protein [Caudoviricetes sp.]
MRKIERLLIAVGVIFFASYIIHLPMCNQDYLRKSSIRLAEDMCKHSTLSQSIKEVLRTNDIAENIENPVKTNFIFAKVKVIFEIANIPVYHWQLARGNLDVSRFIGHIVRHNTSISSEHISRCPDIYFSVGSSFQAGRVIYGL